jgi:hypothetical protein
VASRRREEAPSDEHLRREEAPGELLQPVVSPSTISPNRARYVVYSVLVLYE